MAILEESCMASADMQCNGSGERIVAHGPFVFTSHDETNSQQTIPAGKQHQNDVVSTSMQRDHVASALIRRHFNVACPLGWNILNTGRDMRKCVFGLMWTTNAQADQGLRCPLTESLETMTCINGEQMPE